MWSDLVSLCSIGCPRIQVCRPTWPQTHRDAQVLGLKFLNRDSNKRRFLFHVPDTDTWHGHPLSITHSEDKGNNKSYRWQRAEGHQVLQERNQKEGLQSLWSLLFKKYRNWVCSRNWVYFVHHDLWKTPEVLKKKGERSRLARGCSGQCQHPHPMPPQH